jgi:ubiquinone/menaquinone biosynthesis C-methylase UbiE
MKKSLSEFNKDAYNQISECYKEMGGSIGTQKFDWEKHIVRAINRYMPKNSGKTASALEFGPGTGDVLSILDKHCKFTTAIELSPEMAKEAQTKAPTANIIIDNIHNVDFKKGAFDLIVANASIHTVPKEEAEKVIEKFLEWLDDEGILILTTTIQAEQNLINSAWEHTGAVVEHPYSGIPRYREYYTTWSLWDLTKGFMPSFYDSIAPRRWREPNGHSWTMEVLNKLPGVSKPAYPSEVAHERVYNKDYVDTAMVQRRLARTPEDILPTIKTHLLSDGEVLK